MKQLAKGLVGARTHQNHYQLDNTVIGGTYVKPSVTEGSRRTAKQVRVLGKVVVIDGRRLRKVRINDSLEAYADKLLGDDLYLRSMHPTKRRQVERRLARENRRGA